MSKGYQVPRGKRKGCGMKPKLIIALVIAAVSIFSYFSSSQMNPVTGEKQHVKIDPKQEVALGLQAVPEMTQNFGGESTDAEAQARVKRVGQAVVAGSKAGTSDYPFQFHLLADKKVVNAFALPGGQVFITEALYDKLDTEGELAGVLAHEVGHVIGRHGAEHLAKQALTQGLTGAAVIAAVDPDNPNSTRRNAMMAAAAAQLINMKYGRSDENESDKFGVQFMVEAGYDPRSMIKVMEVLKEAGKGPNPPEFLSTHPDPGNRVQSINAEIKKEFPNGVPDGLKP